MYIFNNIYWQRGIFNTLKSKYSIYLITGDPFCLSNWFLLLYAKILNKKVYLWTHGWYGREGFLKKNHKKNIF